MKEEWLFPNAIVPVDVETTAALVAEIHRLIGVVGGMALAQPEQEPVAWLDGPHLVVRSDMRDRLNYKGPWVDLGRAIPDKWTPLLFTTPPQRKPLTNGEIYTAYITATNQTLRATDERLAFAFARAIEAAHHIKE